MKKIFFISFLFLLKFSFAYEIKGTLKIARQWQPVIYLASINAPEDLFVASPEFIINSGTIDSNGNFLLKGDDLPEDRRFYRLYLVQNSFAAVEFYSQPVCNFMHLIANNNDKIEITNENPDDIFGTVLFRGSEENQTLHSFENEYYRKKIQLDKGSTKSKRDFLNIRLNNFIRDFTNSCNDPLFGLFALYHIEDKETDFLRNSEFYFNFQERMINSYPNSPYTRSYNELLDELTGFRDLVCKIPQLSPPWKNWVIGIETVLILLLLAMLLFRKKKTKKSNSTENPFLLLSDKELQILETMADGKANKEIAAALFIELSTVKTHINNINKKLGTSNRQEIISLYNQMKNNQKKGD